MRIALCQIDPTIGDFDGNLERILAAARQARRQGAELAIFPELALCGYPPRDLLDRPAFVQRAEEALERLRERVPEGLAVLLGTVDRAPEGASRPLRNVAVLLRRGREEGRVAKRLLPTYDVFDEDRHFEPGREPGLLRVEGVRLGVTICEDAWNDVESPLRERRYPVDPVREVVEAGAELIVNLSASPFTLPKLRGRPAMLASIAARHERPLLFVNQVGANDDLIFDGDSGLFDAEGRRVAALPRFEEAVRVVDPFAPAAAEEGAVPREEAAALEALALGVRDYARKCGFERVVLGLSGGIDSALVACIAARALGPEAVLGLAMPSRYSSRGSVEDARALAEALGIELLVVPIEPLFEAAERLLEPALSARGSAPPGDVTFENVQARLRGLLLMAWSNREGRLLLTTGNKSEVAVGYCTLYGDMAGGLAVISDVPKTMVYRLAEEVNRQAGRDVIPRAIFEKPPSAELRPEQTDQDSLPPYELLDAILQRLVEERMPPERIVAEGFEEAVVRRVAELVRRAEYKRRQMPPGLILTRKAFGPGRRVPIAHRFLG